MTSEVFMPWIESNAGLWGLLALVVAVIVGLPSVFQLMLSLREGRKTTDELHATLRATMGRVSGLAFQNVAIGTRRILPSRVQDPDARRHDGVAHLYDCISAGKAALIVGEGGSGKSQLLQELHTHSYQKAVSAHDPLIEVVSLGAYSTEKRGRITPVEWSMQQIARRYRLSNSAVRSLVAEAKLVVALDGLDEVSTTIRAKVAAQLAAAAHTHPIIVTSRPLTDQDEEGHGALLELAMEGRMAHVEMEPLDWQSVKIELETSKVPHINAMDVGAKSYFSNPLYLQILLFLWSTRRISQRELADIFSKPDAIFQRFIAGQTAVKNDGALRLAAFLSTDIGKSRGGPFKLSPLLLGGRAITIASFITLASFVCLTWNYPGPVFTISLGLAVIWNSPYVNKSWLDRVALLWPGPYREWKYLLTLLVASLITVQVVRVTIRSISFGRLNFGAWSEALDMYWLNIAIWIVFFMLLSPMSINSSLFVLSNYQRRHLWTHFAILAAFAFYVSVAQLNTPPMLIIFLIYQVQACIYLVVSFILAWTATKVPPWQWRSSLNKLAQRGILCRDGERFRFTHARIEQQILWILANERTTPRSLWSLLGPWWVDKMLNGEIASDAFRPSITAVGVLERLGRRQAWSLSVTSALYCYFQWIALDRHKALKLITHHHRLHPRSPLRPLLADALDRVGDYRGLSLARRLLQNCGDSPHTINWCLRVVERHHSYSEVKILVEQLLNRRSDPDEASTYLEYRLSLYKLSPDSRSIDGSPSSDELYESAVDPLDLARFALENPFPNLDVAERILTRSPRSALRHTRAAQLAFLRYDLIAANREIAQAFQLVEHFEGYQVMLEIMLTAAAIGRETWAVEWVDRAYDSGLRLRGRAALLRNLGLSDNDRLCRVLSDATPTFTGE